MSNASRLMHARTLRRLAATFVSLDLRLILIVTLCLCGIICALIVFIFFLVFLPPRVPICAEGEAPAQGNTLR